MFLHDRKRDDKKFLNLLKRHCDAEENLLSLFRSDNIEIETLKEKILQLQQVREDTLLLFDEKDEYNERKELKISGNIVKEKEFDIYTINTYNSAKTEIESIYKAISNEKIPVINLNIFKNFLVYISPYFLSSSPNFDEVSIEGVISVLSSNKTENDIPVMLRNGKKIVITSRNPDFTDFDYSELVEILRFLDTLVSDNDSSLDHLRTEIVKQINAISSVSLIKF